MRNRSKIYFSCDTDQGMKANGKGLLKNSQEGRRCENGEGIKNVILAESGGSIAFKVGK